MVDELIQKFVELQNQTEQLLTENKPKEAKQKYMQLVDVYHIIQNSKLENFNKELAYENVTTLFKKVNSAKAKTKLPYHLIIAGILLLIFGTVVILDPSIVGLTALDDVARMPVDLTFTESGIKTLTLKEKPLSIMASGEFNGTAKLYLKSGEKMMLVLDTANMTGGIFTDVCKETCSVIAQSNSIELFAQVDSGILKINEIAYKIQTKSNTPPHWIGASKAFKAKVGKQVAINMDEYFADTEKDKLVFLSTTDDGLTVTIQNNRIVLTPKTAGTKKITLIASDLIDITKVPVTIDVS